MEKKALLTIEKSKLPYWMTIGFGTISATLIIVFITLLGIYPILTCISNSCCNTTTQFWSDDQQKCVNLLNYSDTCKNDNECDKGLGLVCRQGTNGNKTCDCVEASGNVSYWNGSICLKSLDYGAQCSSSISRQCRTDLNLSCINSICMCNSSLQYWSTTYGTCIKYGLYSGSCTTNSDCISSLNLVCNQNSTSCNCPSYIDSLKCDCVRVYGNESYWNGSSCVKALAQGTTCTSSSTTYMCQTLTQGTICNNTGGSYTCQCSYDQYFNTTKNRCETKSSTGGSCTNSSQCRTDLGLTCVGSVCSCTSPNPYWAIRLQRCVSVGQYVDPCTKISDCDQDVFLLCNTVGQTCDCPVASANNKCDCPRTFGNEYYWNSTNCVPAVYNGTACLNASTSYMCQTQTQGTICNVTTSGKFACQCPLTKYFEKLQNKCINQETNGGSCTINVACRTDVGLYCNTVTGKCECIAGTRWLNSKQLCQ